MTLPKENWSYTTEFDGGDKGCGDLIFDLRFFFQPLPPGTRVCVRATDPGAVIDIAAWCRQTGHTLIDEQHPFYLIQRRT